jgi:hypothetical protein
MPVTPGAYDTSFNTGGNQIGGHGPSDAYIAKYTPDGQLVWATYLGGPNYDRAYAIELDPAGDVVISGRAGPGFPTTPGVFQPEYKGNGGGFYGVQGGFVAKLSADGATSCGRATSASASSPATSPSTRPATSTSRRGRRRPRRSTTRRRGSRPASPTRTSRSRSTATTPA